MPNKPVRQSAKYKEQQLRKRTVTQSRPGGSVETAEPEELGTSTVRLDGVPVSDVTTVRFAPATAARAGVATATRPAAVAPARPGVVPRRPVTIGAVSAVRTARGRIAAQMQEMNLTDEMAFIRGDIRRLLILAAFSFAVLIVLAFLIH